MRHSWQKYDVISVSFNSSIYIFCGLGSNLCRLNQMCPWLRDMYVVDNYLTHIYLVLLINYEPSIIDNLKVIKSDNNMFLLYFFNVYHIFRSFHFQSCTRKKFVYLILTFYYLHVFTFIKINLFTTLNNHVVQGCITKKSFYLKKNITMRFHISGNIFVKTINLFLPRYPRMQ